MQKKVFELRYIPLYISMQVFYINFMVRKNLLHLNTDFLFLNFNVKTSTYSRIKFKIYKSFGI